MSWITKYINLPVFIVSFAFGVFAVYVTLPETKTIIVYPSPETASTVQYKDKANHCFRFDETKVRCSKDNNSLKIPAQA